MAMVSRIWNYLNAQRAIRFNRKDARLVNRNPMISFTFDDFPMSACEAGKLLKANQCNGTFYTCLNLMDASADGEIFYDRDSLLKLIEDGHEIGSHTFAHLNCKLTDTGTLSGDLAKNQEAIEKITGGYKLKNFAFPFGAHNNDSKKLAGQTYSSSRSIIPGINKGTIDLNLLKANKLYNHIPIDSARELIRQNKEENGWLIFYTHDVKDQPSPYGCTLEYFRTVLEAALDSGAEVVTIQQGIQQAQLLKPSINLNAMYQGSVSVAAELGCAAWFFEDLFS
jgi:peptidoglycan/xylan/chitin deacetylase (PgdA/CDA1 family)